MNLTEIQSDLQNFTKKKVSLSQIGEVLGISRAAISKRSLNGSDIGVSELQQIEQHFGASLYRSGVYNLERQNDTQIEEKMRLFGDRLGEIQDKHNFLDSEMAKLLKISTEDYNKLLTGAYAPDIDVLNQIKRNFKVSLDWLLYGE